MLQIGEREVGPGKPVFVVAELSGNHHGSYATAETLIQTAAESGADAVKTQCFTPEEMTLKSDTEPFSVIWQGRHRSLYDLYCETAMPMHWHPKLKSLASSLGLLYFASVFSTGGVDFLESLGVPCYKIASFEITHVPLIEYAAKTKKPLLISTGMALEKDIWDACTVATLDPAIESQIALLKCTSAYPANSVFLNLSTITNMGMKFCQVTGLSDHSRSNVAVTVAVALGASIIERHLILDRTAGGADAAFSDEPYEFCKMVEIVRETELTLGSLKYGPTEQEKNMLRYRRSLWIIADVAAGETFTSHNIRILRPADGVAPNAYSLVLGKRASRNCRRGEPVNWSMVLF